IGLYLPFQISLAVFIGGAIKFIVDKFFKKQSENGLVVAAGLFGGESITGVVIAFMSMFI
ncbi:MAG: OPT/YSL family transporter, partial [Firmicutes bacterium]|nr:OPT/YSL family transporter [Bacillota bacterium]